MPEKTIENQTDDLERFFPEARSTVRKIQEISAKLAEKGELTDSEIIFGHVARSLLAIMEDVAFGGPDSYTKQKREIKKRIPPFIEKYKKEVKIEEIITPNLLKLVSSRRRQN